SPQRFKGLEDRGDGVVQARVRRSEVPAVDAQAKEAENGPARRLPGVEGSGPGQRAGTDAHRVEPGKRQRDAGALQKRSARQGLALREDVHGVPYFVLNGSLATIAAMSD